MNKIYQKPFSGEKNAGFTLIELLVVVLIIGILSSIALPQYTAAVEKARAAEALQNIAVIEKQMELYLLENGNQTAKYKDFTNVDLSGGEWTEDGRTYNTKNFEYYGLGCGANECYMEVIRNGGLYTLLSTTDIDGWGNKHGIWYRGCVTQETEIGRKICKGLEGSGWKYMDTQL